MRLDFFVPALFHLTYRKATKNLPSRAVKSLRVGGYQAHLRLRDRDDQRFAAQWRARVQEAAFAAARAAGWRDPVPSRGWCVMTHATFSTGSHFDAENVHKGLVDCLVGRTGHSSKGTGLFLEDRDLAGYFDTPIVASEGMPRACIGVQVTIFRGACAPMVSDGKGL